MGDLTKDFSRSEFAADNGECWIDAGFVARLQRARDFAGIPFVVDKNGGCRTSEQNERAGGKEDSAHKRGHAADLKALDSRSRFLIVDALLQVGFRRIGIGKTFVHVDDDPSLPDGVIWLY